MPRFTRIRTAFTVLTVAASLAACSGSGSAGSSLPPRKDTSSVSTTPTQAATHTPSPTAPLTDCADTNRPKPKGAQPTGPELSKAGWVKYSGSESGEAILKRYLNAAATLKLGRAGAVQQPGENISIDMANCEEQVAETMGLAPTRNQQLQGWRQPSSGRVTVYTIGSSGQVAFAITIAGPHWIILAAPDTPETPDSLGRLTPDTEWMSTPSGSMFGYEGGTAVIWETDRPPTL